MADVLGEHIVGLCSISNCFWHLNFCKKNIYWSPARKWLAKNFDLIFPEPDTSKGLPTYTLIVNLFHLFNALIFIAIGIYVIKMGVDTFIRDGFLGQNLIYLIFFR